MNFAHNSNGLPIHAGNGQNPHVTLRDANGPLGGGTYHIPYQGQTTLGMYGIGQPGESFQQVSQHNLGTLNHSQATYKPWFSK